MTDQPDKNAILLIIIQAKLAFCSLLLQKTLAYHWFFSTMPSLTGRGAVWLARMTGGHEVGGSSPLAPIFFFIFVDNPPKKIS
jgi:hypothetical protein